MSEAAAATATPASTPAPAATPVPAENAKPNGEEGKKADPATGGEQKQAQPVSKWLQKLKVDGAEEELNLEDDATLKKVLATYSKAKGSEKRFAEANAIKKQAEAEAAQVRQFVAALKAKPDEILTKMGIDFDKLAEDRLMAKIERQKMPVEQRVELEYKEKLALLQQEATRNREMAEQAQLERETAIQQQRMESEIMAALDQSNKLPKTPTWVARVAFNLEQAMKRGIELTAQEATKMAEMEYEGDMGGYVKASGVEKLYELLGPAGVAELIKLHTSKGGAGATPQLPQPPASGIQQSGNGNQPRKKMGMEEYFSQLDKRLGTTG